MLENLSFAKNLFFYFFNFCVAVSFLHNSLWLTAITFVTSLSYTDVLTKSSSTISLSLLKPVPTVFSVSIYTLSTSDFRPDKSTFLASFDLSTPVAFSLYLL